MSFNFQPSKKFLSPIENRFLDVLDTSPLHESDFDVKVDYSQILPSSIPDIHKLTVLKSLNLKKDELSEEIQFIDTSGRTVTCILPSVGCCVEGTKSEKCDQVNKFQKTLFIRKI